MYDWRMELYWRLPIAVQEFVLGRYAARLDRLYYGSGYAEVEGECRSLRGLTREQIAHWQMAQLRTLLDTAGRNATFYRDRWTGIPWQKVQGPSDLTRLPLLDKQDVRANEHAFLSCGADPRTLFSDRTSGTTGTAITIYWFAHEIKKWWAHYEVSCREIAGVNRSMPRAMIGGRSIIKGKTRKPPFWRYNRRWRQLYLSAYHISPTTVPYYVEALKHYRPEWITGYALRSGHLPGRPWIRKCPRCR